MPQPYPGQQWKHGWIPLTPGAIRSKNHGRQPGLKSKLGRRLARLSSSSRDRGSGGSPSRQMDAAIRNRAAQRRARDRASNRRQAEAERKTTTPLALRPGDVFELNGVEVTVLSRPERVPDKPGAGRFWARRADTGREGWVTLPRSNPAQVTRRENLRPVTPPKRRASQPTPRQTAPSTRPPRTDRPRKLEVPGTEEDRQNAALSPAAFRRKARRLGTTELRTGSGTTDGVRWERIRSNTVTSGDQSRYEVTVNGERITIRDTGQSPAEVVAQAKREAAQRQRRRAEQKRLQEYNYRTTVREILRTGG